MFEHTEKVVLAGKEYPIRCDINVLAEIQEQFDTISNFEMLLTGAKMAMRCWTMKTRSCLTDAIRPSG